MKKLLFLPVLFLFLACGSKSELEQKKEELNGYRTEQQDLATKIETLEKEIAVLDTSKHEEKPMLVAVAAVTEGNFNHFIDLQGVVDSDENIAIQPGMPGVVTKVLVKEGDAVSTGQLLAEVDNRAIREGMEQLQTNINFAKTTYEKQERLWKQKIGSEMQYLQAQTQYQSLQSSLATMQAQLDMSRIKSPISGVVDEVNIKIGEYAAPGPGLFRVVNSNKLKVTCKVADSYISKVKIGAPVSVYLKDINDTIKGNVSFISKSVNTMSRTFLVEIRIPGAGKDIRPNMLATVSINDENQASAISVPSNLIQRDASGQKYMLVSETSGKAMKARKKVVTTGLSYGDRTVIAEGIAATDQLITSGYQEVVDGQTITLK